MKTDTFMDAMKATISLISYQQEVLKPIQQALVGTVAQFASSFHSVNSYAVFNYNKTITDSLQLLRPAFDHQKLVESALIAFEPIMTHKAMFNSITKVAKSLDIQQIFTSGNINNLAKAFESLSNVEYSLVDDEIFEVEDLSESEIEGIRQAISDVATSIDSDEEVKEQVEKLSNKNSRLKVIFEYILLFLSYLLLLGNASLFIAQRNAVIRGYPHRDAPIISNITINQEFIVTGSVPYYYQIKFFDQETQVLNQEYIYKNAATPIELSDKFYDEDENDGEV